ncbi:MAG: D-sedoheptulose 7-phosphate isomerase [Candidatus Omnitrophota bacterium]|nr:D-sedoheptulose 7-phosphate isomerase [Candidatus Omnitrophota bacterium]
MKNKIADIINESIFVEENTLQNQLKNIEGITKALINCLKKGGKVIFCGNGGSAADSQHLAAELIGRFKKNRRALAAVSLTTNTSVLTSLANDFGFESVFARQVEALAKKGDLLVAISTSGNSPNVIEAVKQAKKMQVKTVAFTGADGGKLARITDISLIIPSHNTPRIQEAHITVGHAICQLVEEVIFNK